jgi:signal recognition particle subunit SRP54
MFESLSQRLSTTVNRLRGRGRLTEENIREALREVRIALLEADVALPVVQALIQRIKVRAVGQEVVKSLSPGQALVKVVSDELTVVMGSANTELNLAQQPPAIVLMAGLQGAGKTTTVAKLARLLTERKKKKVMVVSCDVYRPAAIESTPKAISATVTCSLICQSIGCGTVGGARKLSTATSRAASGNTMTPSAATGRDALTSKVSAETTKATSDSAAKKCRSRAPRCMLNNSPA